MKFRFVNTPHVVAAIVLLMLSHQSLFGQNAQTYHANSILLDGGSGNTIFLPAPVSGGAQIFGWPVGAGIIATQGYVTTQLGNYLPLAGGTMAGNIVMGNHNISGGNTISATSFVGNLTGNATTATTATNLVLPFGGSSNVNGGLFSIFETGAGGSAIVGSSPQGNGFFGSTTTGNAFNATVSGAGTGVSANASGTGGVAIEAFAQGTSLPLELLNTGTNPTDVSATNWSISHAGAFSGTVAAYLPLAGGTMTGNIAMQSNKVTSTTGVLALSETGGTYGSSEIDLKDIASMNGMLINEGGSAVNVADLAYLPGTGVQSNIRLEERSVSLHDATNNTTGEFQFIDNINTVPVTTFAIGKATAYMHGNLTLSGTGFVNSLTSTTDISANGVIVGSQGGNQSTVVGNGAVSSAANTTAIGYYAVNSNTGTDNTAVGTNALRNSGGLSTNYNTGIGSGAGSTNGGFGGDNNTFVGYVARAGALVSNASAIGYRSYVTSSNSMVLGSISGVNGAGASTNVGIGTTAPVAMLSVGTASALQVNASGNLVTTGSVTAASFVGPLTGNATTASSVDAGALTGSTLAGGVTGSSLTSVGTLGSLAVSGAATTGMLSIGGGAPILSEQKLSVDVSGTVIAGLTSTTFAITGPPLVGLNYGDMVLVEFSNNSVIGTMSAPTYISWCAAVSDNVAGVVNVNLRNGSSAVTLPAGTLAYLTIIHQ